MKRISLLGLVSALALLEPAAAQQPPSIPRTDAIRLAEAFRLADAVGDKIWPKWSAAPFAVILITPDYEFLVRHPGPTPDWISLGHDTLLDARVWYRKRQFPVTFLATFPAVGNTPTIVVGQAEHTTAKTSTPWVLTLLHEHFHQYQYSQPGYYDSAATLGLAHGDSTGMWMLNFPFPYADKAVQKKFAAAARALREALYKNGTPALGNALATYRGEMATLRASISAEAWTYLQFQLWQEGIARYTEFVVAGAATRGYRPDSAFSALKDFVPYSSVAQSLFMGISDQLLNEDLGDSKRSVVYDFGAAQGLILDYVQPHWRTRYFTPMFTVDARLEPPK